MTTATILATISTSYRLESSLEKKFPKHPVLFLSAILLIFAHPLFHLLVASFDGFAQEVVKAYLATWRYLGAAWDLECKFCKFVIGGIRATFMVCHHFYQSCGLSHHRIPS